MSRIGRRQFLVAAGALLAAPLAIAQQARRPYRVGWPNIATRGVMTGLIEALEKGLREQGYVIGRDVIIEFRSAADQSAGIADIAAQTVAAKPDAARRKHHRNDLGRG